MLITGKKNIRGTQLEHVLNKADGAVGYAIITRQTHEILAIASTRDELVEYWDKLKCVIPAEDLQLAGYRKKAPEGAQTKKSVKKTAPKSAKKGAGNDKRRSTGKSKAGTGTRG